MGSFNLEGPRRCMVNSPGMERPENTPDIKKLITLPLFSALTAVGAYIIIPLPWSPVPLALQSFFALLAGLVLGPGPGALSMGLYILLGILGLPVFAGGTGGLVHLAGPTAGYLLSYPAAAGIAGLMSRPGKGGAPAGPGRLIFAALAGSLAVYSLGVPWLKFRLGLSWTAALTGGMLPFLAGDILKAAAAVMLAPRARAILHRSLGAEL